MPKHDVDPARGRFFTIQAMRLIGVACVVGGMLIAAGRTEGEWLPNWLGYPLLAAGLVAVFVIPTVLARKWRTPE